MMLIKGAVEPGTELKDHAVSARQKQAILRVPFFFVFLFVFNRPTLIYEGVYVCVYEHNILCTKLFLMFNQLLEKIQKP